MATVGQQDISKDYPIPEERTWETIQDLVAEEADLTPQKDRVGL